jgi:hypothetical protein
MADFENILPPVGVEQGVPSSFAGSDMVFTEGVNPLPLNVPLVPYIEDVSIPAVPQGGFSVNYDQNNPFDITKQVLNSPITESDIVFEKSKVKPFQSGYQKTNFNRYYNDTDNFYKLGFDPLSNNDEIYNQNRSWYEDLGRGLLGVPALGLSVVKSSYRGMGEMLTGDFSMTDEIAADEFAQIMAERGSTKGGLTQFSSNLLLQSGFVAGIFADYLATEAVIAGSVALTEGATLPAALAASSAKTAQAARSIASMRNLFTAAGARDAYTAIRGLNATAVGRGIKAVGEAVVPRTLSNIKNTINAGDSVINYANAARGIGDFILDLKQVGYTVAEASMEGGAVKNEFIDDRINEFITNNGYYPEQEEMNKIYELGSDAGFTTSAINTPLIYITNAITFNNLFKGKSAMLNAPTNDVIARSSLTGEKIIADTTGARILTGKEAVKTLLKPKEYLRFGAQYFKTNLSEGLQEISQEITAGASKDYYERLYETPEAGGISIYLADAFENTKKQASMQGLEVFASGFLMGGLTGIAGNLSNVSRRAGSNIYYNYIKNDPEKYNELYKAEQDRFKQIVTEFDDAIKNGNKILTLDVENLLLQARLGTDMVDARKSFDEKAFHDLKDMSRFNAIYTALEAGKFDILVQKLQDMKQMTGDELKQAFDLTDDVTADEAKQVLDVAIERAQQIKEQHKEFADYRNPFNPNRFRRTNLTDPVVKEQYVKEVINYKAFEEARKIAVFSLHGRQQAQKRMADLTDRLTEISSFGKLTFSDITPLLNINSLQQELDLLDSEIKSLTGSTDKEAIKILTSKKNKKKALELYQKNLEKAGDVSDPQILKDKKFLREAFVKYINALSQEAGINFSKGQAEEAYSILTDYYSLNADVVQFTENLNTLYDPTSYYDLVSRLVEQQKYRRDKQTAYMEKSRKAFINAVKIRDFIQYLADGGFGIKLSSLPKDISKDYDEFISTLADDLDIVFIDFKSDREFDKSDVRYVFVLDLINKFNNIVTEPVAETTEEVTETTTEEEVVDQPALSDEIEQEEGVPLIQSVKQFNALPVKLQGLLQATLAQQNSKREADGEPELPLDRFLRTSTSRNAISKFFKDPANAADIKAYNEKKGVPKEKPKEPVVAEPVVIEEEVIITEPVIESIDPIVEKIKNANSIQELNTLQEEFEESDLIEDLDNINAVKDAVALRKAELIKSIKYESIKAGDVLVFGDNKYGLVEKVTTSKLTVVPLYGERLTPAKDANKRITILKKDFSKMVQSVYDTQANVVIGTKNVPSPTAEENKIIEANSQNIDDFLDNEEATKKLEEQTRNKSDKDVNNDFFNNIGC